MLGCYWYFRRFRARRRRAAERIRLRNRRELANPRGRRRFFRRMRRRAARRLWTFALVVSLFALPLPDADEGFVTLLSQRRMAVWRTFDGRVTPPGGGYGPDLSGLRLVLLPAPFPFRRSSPATPRPGDPFLLRQTAWTDPDGFFLFQHVPVWYAWLLFVERPGCPPVRVATIPDFHFLRAVAGPVRVPLPPCEAV